MKLNLPEERTFTGNAMLWKRLAAFAIDFLIINFFIFSPFKKIFEGVAGNHGSFSEVYETIKSNPEVGGSIATAAFFAGFLGMLYFVILEKKMQQSIGKKLMNLSVASSEGEDKKISLWQHIVRNLFFIPIFPIFLLWIIDPLFMVFNKGNSRLSEILSRTKVVQKYVV